MDIPAHLGRMGVALTAAQLQGLSLSEAPTLLLAVPGSGKTTVLVARAAALLDAGVPAEEMLNLTFSRNSARDMEDRFRRLFAGCFPSAPRFSTLHSFCYRLLREFGRQEGRPVPGVVGAEGAPSSEVLIRKAVEAVTGSRPDPDLLTDFAGWVGFAKNRMLAPGSRPPGAPPVFPEVLARYEEEKRAAGLMDYDDMPLYAARILRSRPALCQDWRQRFSRINIDEAQDLSPAQYAVLRLLFPEGRGLFLVGDEDQSIYGFRGASPQELLRFAQGFPGAEVRKMEENFRSRPEILSCCGGFIRLCPERYAKTLRATREKGGRVEQVLPSSMEDAYGEAAALLRELPPGQTAGVLYRNNLTAGPLAGFLREKGIPFRLEPAPAGICRGPVALQNAFLRLCARPGDLEALRRLRFPGELDGGLFEEVFLRADGRQTVPQLLRDCAGRRDRGGFARKLAALLEDCRRRTPGQALEQFERRTLLGERLAARSEKGDPALCLRERQFRHLCARAGDYEELEELLRRAEAPEPFRPEEAVVSLSTIHGAKGLEFDWVLLLDAFEGILPGRTALEDLAAGSPQGYYEEMRLFYVAATRARERLVLFSAPKSWALRDSRFFSDFFRRRGMPQVSLPEVGIGTAVSHRVFGEGVVSAREGDALTVAFADGNMKNLSLSYCISKGLLKVLHGDFR